MKSYQGVPKEPNKENESKKWSQFLRWAIPWLQQKTLLAHKYADFYLAKKIAEAEKLKIEAEYKAIEVRKMALELEEKKLSLMSKQILLFKETNSESTYEELKSNEIEKLKKSIEEKLMILKAHGGSIEFRGSAQLSTSTKPIEDPSDLVVEEIRNNRFKNKFISHYFYTKSLAKKIALVIGFIISASLSILFKLDLALTIFSAFTIIIILIHDRLTKYRIDKGLFGGNKLEAREITRFILKEGENDSDFLDDEGKPYDLNPQEAIESDYIIEIDLEKLKSPIRQPSYGH